ncbi:kinesin-like protein KIF3A [Branchiostoma floridae x Branchiostoma belcheri]
MESGHCVGLHIRNKEKTLILQVSIPKRDGTPKQFIFDKLFPEETTQAEVFNTMSSPIVDAVLEGYNGCILCYGKTGSGKTYTMVGPSDKERDDETEGIIYRTLKKLFLTSERNEDLNFTFLVSVFEIYNEKVLDLTPPERNRKSTGNHLVSANNPKKHRISCVKDALNVFLSASRARKSRETAANQHSSRSHMIFQVVVSIRHKEGTESGRTGELYLVDLAGSEAAGEVNKDAEGLREGANINMSLLHLREVIRDLSVKNRQDFKFRRSKLTMLLKTVLTGNSMVAFIVNVDPSMESLRDTRRSLYFASDAKKVKVKPKINYIPLESLLNRYLKIIAELKRQIKTMTESSISMRSADATTGVLNADATIGVLSADATTGVLNADATIGVLSADATTGVLNADATIGVLSADATIGVLSADATTGVLSADATTGVLSADATIRSTVTTVGVGTDPEVNTAPRASESEAFQESTAVHDLVTANAAEEFRTQLSILQEQVKDEVATQLEGFQTTQLNTLQLLEDFRGQLRQMVESYEAEGDTSGQQGAEIDDREQQMNMAMDDLRRFFLEVTDEMLSQLESMRANMENRDDIDDPCCECCQIGCTGLWYWRPGHKWYSLRGKGAGWVILLLIMHLITFLLIFLYLERTERQVHPVDEPAPNGHTFNLCAHFNCCGQANCCAQCCACSTEPYYALNTNPRAHETPEPSV